MNDLTTLDKLDSRLSYLLKNPDGSECLRFRGLGDGTWQLVNHGNDTAFLMSEAAVSRQLRDWRNGLGTVLIFACCCAKCATPELQELHRSIGQRVTHSYWPACFEEAKASILGAARKALVAA